MRIAVAGTGYVGLVTGVCLASKGHEVTCVDVDESKVEIMRQGISPIYEPGLSELMKDNMERLIFTTDYASAYRGAEVIFIGVGTPEKKDGSANLSYVYKVVEQIAETVEQECVVVVKSTVCLLYTSSTEKISLCVLGSGIFCLSPYIFHRMYVHTALAGHWILIAAIAIWLSLIHI